MDLETSVVNYMCQNMVISMDINMVINMVSYDHIFDHKIDHKNRIPPRPKPGWNFVILSSSCRYTLKQLSDMCNKLFEVPLCTF